MQFLLNPEELLYVLIGTQQLMCCRSGVLRLDRLYGIRIEEAACKSNSPKKKEETADSSSESVCCAFALTQHLLRGKWRKQQFKTR